MEETIWEILHLEVPTSNIDEIKKAYSEQSKKCNPEENPEQFQELYKAYKLAISYARRRNLETEYQKPNIESVINEINKNELFDQIDSNEINLEKDLNHTFKSDFQENELIKTFENINEIDRNEFDKIQEMIAKINKNFNEPDELEKVVQSEEFFELMKSKDFQINLSIYLNNRPGNFDPNYVIFVAYRKFFSENIDAVQVESLNRYFDPLVRRIQAGNAINKPPNRIVTTITSVIIILSIFAGLISSTVIDNDENNKYSSKKILTTSNNEVLTYEYDENIKEIVSNDQDFSIKYTIPEGFKLKEEYFNSDYGKYYENNNNIIFGVATNPCGVEEYYDIWNESEVGKLNKTTIKGTQFYYIQFPNMRDNKQEGVNLIFWTEISDKDVLIIDTKSNIEKEQFISLIENILPLSITINNKR